MGESGLEFFCRPIIPFIESQEILIGVGSGSSGQMCEDKQSRPNPPRTTVHRLLKPPFHPAVLNLNTHTLSHTHNMQRTTDHKHPLHSNLGNLTLSQHNSYTHVCAHSAFIVVTGDSLVNTAKHQLCTQSSVCKNKRGLGLAYASRPLSQSTIKPRLKSVLLQKHMVEFL